MEHVSAANRLLELRGDLRNGSGSVDGRFPAYVVENMLADLYGCGRADALAERREAHQDGWQAGWDLANNVAQREREEDRDLLLQVVARLDRKDRADGVIGYRVYPDPTVYDWERSARWDEEQP